jgi:hypothetical protein
MATYYADFIAYVDERKRPENFPREVHVIETYADVDNPDQLKAIVNDRFVKLVTSAGLVVLKEPNGILENGIITFDKRRFVPWHMLTHMEAKVTMIQEPPMPQDPLIPPGMIPFSSSEIEPKETIQ